MINVIQRGKKCVWHRDRCYLCESYLEFNIHDVIKARYILCPVCGHYIFVDYNKLLKEIEEAKKK